jgi:site-specific recombinase XerD
MKNVRDLEEIASRKVMVVPRPFLSNYPDSIQSFIDLYLQLAVYGIRSEEVAKKIRLHISRFHNFFVESYGHDRISACLKRDVLAWQSYLLAQGMAPSTVNNHLASLSAFTSWVSIQDPGAFPAGDPAKGIGELGLSPLEPRVLSEAQVRSLKNICDRLERFHQLKGRRWQSNAPGRSTGRPWRDRAIVFVLLSSGLRREELVRLDLEQVNPNTPEELRAARRAKINRVKGKGKTERVVFLSADARGALADYLEKERPLDASDACKALFLSAVSLASRKSDGRLSPRSINLILEQIGRWHDGEIKDLERHISPLHPHALRHTFAFQLAAATGADAYELERRLGHRSQRYIQRYTNPPEDVAAGYVEEF